MTPEQFEDARTLAAYWLMADHEKRRQMWTSDIKKICEALLANPAPSAQEAGLREALELLKGRYGYDHADIEQVCSAALSVPAPQTSAEREK